MTLYTSALKPFAFNTSDIEFLLAQVNFRPLFDSTGNVIINWNGTGAIYDSALYLTTGVLNPNRVQLWDGISNIGGFVNTDTDGAGTDTATTFTAAELIARAAAAINVFGASYQSVTDLSGLRDVSGLYNSLSDVNATYGAVDQLFPRMAAADYTNYAPTLTGGALGAFAANLTYNSRFGGAGFEALERTSTALNESTDYTITAHVGPATATTATANDGTILNMNNIVDYTPRMISLLTTTGGVTYDTWAAHAGDPGGLAGHQPNEIYYDANGVATVTNWGVLASEGQVDTQVRFAGSAGENEKFIGGLNPGVSPSNGFFVLFGQFFDHGLDFIDKGAQGATIKITFSTADPLYGMAGPDGQPVYAITMARASVQSIDANGPQYVDHTSPFIDQSQTYGSHEQLTTLLREWVHDPANGGDFHAGIKMLDGHTLATEWKSADGTMVRDTLPTLNELRAHVEATGRDALNWDDVLNLRNRDLDTGALTSGTSGSALILDMNPRFDDAHLHGYYDVNLNGVRDPLETGSANAAQNAAVDAAIATLDAYAKTAFGALSTFEINATTHKLTLYMENVPVTAPPGTPNLNEGANAMGAFVNFGNMSIMFPAGAEHDAVGTLLLASVGDHYIAGDGRVNENFGLTSIHHVFHEEHNYQVGNFMDALHREAISTGSFNNLHGFQVDMTGSGGSIDAITGDYLNASGQVTWDLNKMFNAAKLVVEMEYQHAAVDQYARNVTPNIQEFVGYSPNKDPSVTLEYAQAAFRFGHSTLRETIDTIDPEHGLTGKIMGYALRDAFLNPDKYADLGPASIILGMSHQQMNEVDEFITPALNQGLLGQALDLAAINIARGRDLGIPTLNDFREAIGLARYSSWTDFGNNMQHPSSLVNFIAAYSFDGDLAAAQAVLDGAALGHAADLAFLEGGDLGFNQIDTWLGGLAEIHQPGGLLGETFDLVFLTQIESLMDGDRFYYLFRLAGQQFAEEVGGGQLKDIVERNTGLTHLNGNIFGYADKYYDFSATKDTVNTTSNNHKWASEIAAWELAHPGQKIGVYSNNGLTDSADGTVVTVGGVDYIRDTRLEDTGQDTGAANLNGGVNLDGTPNSGGESNEVLVGTAGDDLIYAGGGDDTVYGEDGNDTIFGGYGIDRLYGGNGSDTLYGGDNPDLMDGGSGDDFIYGESSGSDINGADQLIGGSGNDFVSGGVGIDKLSGGTGDDHVVGDGDTDPFTHGSDGNDLLEGNSGGDILYGDNGDDIVVGGADQDQMFGGNGDDIIRPGDPTGALTIGTDESLGGDGVTDLDGNGKQGFDILDFSDNGLRTGGVTFNLASQVNPAVTVNGTPTQTQSFQMEGVVGSVGNDTLTGGSTNAAGDIDNDWIIGGSGNDLLTGGAGDDIIVGGSVRLDALIGKYNTTYDHNNNNDGSTEALQLQDARYQGASQRVDYTDSVDATGIIDAANALGGATYEKHFKEMLRSNQFKDTILGDGGAAGGDDTVVLSGNRGQYTVEFVNAAGHNVVRLTDTRPGSPDGTDLIVDVKNFKFADGTFTFDSLQSSSVASITTSVSADEGNVGVTHRIFTVTLTTGAPTGGASVNFTTQNGTAVAGSDYVAQSGTLHFLAGETTKTIDIVVNGDTNYEANEAFTVLLSNPINALISGATGTGTIVNDDAAPSMSVAPVFVPAEGNTGSTTVALTISLSAISSTPITVNYATADGTATAGSDYAALTGSVIFAPGETSKTVNVSISGDVLDEVDETIAFNLTSTQTLNASASGMITITDDDAPPVVSIGNVIVSEAPGTVQAHFTVSLSAVSAKNVTVAYTTTPGSALAGSDFVATSGTVTILAGSNSADVPVTIVNDTLHETSPEYMLVALSAPSNATLGNATGVGFINDDDGVVLNSAITLAASPEDAPRIITSAELMVGALNNASPTLVVTGLSVLTGGGSIVDNGNGTWTYTPALNNEGGATFQYTVTDGGVSTNGGAIMDLTPVNDAPTTTAALTLVSVNDNSMATGDLRVGVSDVDLGDTLHVNVPSVTATLGAVAGTTAAALATAAGFASVAAFNAALTTVVQASITSSTGALNLNTNSFAGFNALEPGQTATISLTYDVADVAGLTAAQTASLVVSGILEDFPGTANRDILTGTAWGDFLQGFDGNDDLFGLGGNDRLEGGNGVDWLNGGTGADMMIGGAGDDWYEVDNSGDVVVDLAGQGASDTIRTSISYTLTASQEIERLLTVRTGTNDINLTGNDIINEIRGNNAKNTLTGLGGNDLLIGYDEADYLVGGTGADTMDGGRGDDFFEVDNAGDVIIEAVEVGSYDTVRTEVDYTLTAGAEVERLTARAAGTAALVMTGNEFGNAIYGNAGANTLNGKAGNDSLFGRDGADTIIQDAADTGRDIVDGGNGVDTYVLNGTNAAETFDIYAISGGQNGGLAGSLGTTFAASSTIVITRTVGATTSVMAELSNIEEIKILTSSNGVVPLAVTVTGGTGDTISVHGNFVGTGLAYNTITIDGSGANDTVNISDLSSAHRIVFNTAGGADTVIGTLRPQDVINGLTSTPAQTALALTTVDDNLFHFQSAPRAESQMSLVALDALNMLTPAFEFTKADRLDQQVDLFTGHFILHQDWHGTDGLFNFSDHGNGNLIQ
jgi:Ca2+-binding RTX toxin-like protein